MSPPNYNNWPSIFWALYVALSSLILPLRQPIRPFTSNKALSGPPYTAIGHFFPVAPRSGSSGGLRRLCGGPPFSQTEDLKLSCGLRCLIKIWCVDRFGHSQTSAATKTEAGNRFPTLLPPSWKLIWQLRWLVAFGWNLVSRYKIIYKNSLLGTTSANSQI